jgi:hypothetical protein
MKKKSDVSNLYEQKRQDTISSNRVDLEKRVINKKEQTKKLLKNSLKLISNIDNDVANIKHSIKRDVNRLQDVKSNFLNTTFTQNRILLEKASYKYTKNRAEEPFEIYLGTTDANIKIKDINSGSFTPLFLSFITMIITIGVWIYYASLKIGLTLQFQPLTIPTVQDFENMLLSIGGIVGGGGENGIIFGLSIVGVSALIFALLVYKSLVSIRDNKNFKIANDIYKKSYIYVNKQKKSKIEMDRIDEHIKKITPMIINYKYLLDEKNAILQRILHVEGRKKSYSEYHQSSIESIKDTEKLMNKIEELITTPITKDGKLNRKAERSLREAKDVYDYYISKIYN